MLEKLVHFCTRYMAAGVILAGVCGIIWPSLMKPFARYIPIFLGVIMFGMGMSLTPRDFKNVFDHPKNIALGTLFQFIFMPALAFALVKLFALPPAIAIGVILVGCCPGGTASNVISYIARADVALSVSMTMVNTILAPFVTPFLIWVTAGAWVDISFTSMMISIIEMVLLPLLSGVLLNIFFPKAVSKVTKITPMLSALVIIFTVGCVVSLSGRTILDSRHDKSAGTCDVDRGRHAEFRPCLHACPHVLHGGRRHRRCYLLRMAQHFRILLRFLVCRKG